LVIHILGTTVDETGADFLNKELNLGLNGITLIIGSILVVVLVFQFMSKKYMAEIYWLSVVLISIVGTLITNNLTVNLGVSLETTTIIFTVSLAVVFTVWYKKEKTLSIRSIIITRRKRFYMLAVLFTFALGTAAEDLLSETIDRGYLLPAIIFGH